MSVTPKLICTRPHCADPFCDRELPEASDGDVVLGDDCVFYALCAAYGDGSLYSVQPVLAT